ncbi:MAG TPA: FtsW/RodA/SpoVE family cell cycle protein [Candidatus Paceibacterota bacterium]
MIISRKYLPDSILLFIVCALVILGVFVFTSASFGLLTRDGATWTNVLFSQIVLGLGGGLLLGFIAYIIPLAKYRRFSLWLVLFAGLLCLILFIPGVGFYSGGAVRWIHLFGISFQPSEFLKISLIIFLAHWASIIKGKIKTSKEGLLPFLGFMGVAGVLIVSEPDTGTFLVMLASALGIFITAGGRYLHIAYIFLAGLLLVGGLVIARPYVRERIATFFDPDRDPLGASYQSKQALLAIGSGQLTGRGFGQSVQKYRSLPEPIGDSVFAVLGEEFGFVGTTILLLLYLSFFLRGLTIANRSSDEFHRLLGVGLAIMITAQAFMHIGALIGLIPLTGVPLPFVSHGGTALMFSLIATGLLLQVSNKQNIT